MESERQKSWWKRHTPKFLCATKYFIWPCMADLCIQEAGACVKTSRNFPLLFFAWLSLQKKHMRLKGKVWKPPGRFVFTLTCSVSFNWTLSFLFCINVAFFFFWRFLLAYFLFMSFSLSFLPTFSFPTCELVHMLKERKRERRIKIKKSEANKKMAPRLQKKACKHLPLKVTSKKAAWDIKFHALIKRWRFVSKGFRVTPKNKPGFKPRFFWFLNRFLNPGLFGKKNGWFPLEETFFFWRLRFSGTILFITLGLFFWS